jgi:hypothetical protein
LFLHPISTNTDGYGTISEGLFVVLNDDDDDDDEDDEDDEDDDYHFCKFIMLMFI